MRRLLTSLVAIGLAGTLAACQEEEAAAPEATMESATPDPQTGGTERTGPEEQTGGTERTGPEEQTGGTERTGPAEQ